MPTNLLLQCYCCDVAVDAVAAATAVFVCRYTAAASAAAVDVAIVVTFIVACFFLLCVLL